MEKAVKNKITKKQSSMSVESKNRTNVAAPKAIVNEPPRIEAKPKVKAKKKE